MAIGAYTNQKNAADVRDIRQALNIEKWNLWGVSYGTALAQEVMRIDPTGINAVVLDGVVLLSRTWSLDTPHSFRYSLLELEKYCAQTVDCRSKYPLMETLFFKAFENLEANPMTLGTDNVYLYRDEKGQFATYDGSVIFNAGDFSAKLHSLLYSTSDYSLIPALLEAGATNNKRLVEAIINEHWSFGIDGGFDLGAYFAIACSFLQKGSVSPVHTAYIGGDDLSTRNICNELGLETGDINPPLTAASSIPTLLLSGKYDPITPPHHADEASLTLPNSQHIVFQNGAHSVSSTNCGSELAVAFFTNPKAPLDSSCAETTLNTKFPSNIFVANGSDRYEIDLDLGISWVLEESASMLLILGLIVLVLIDLRGFIIAAFKPWYTRGLATILVIAASYMIWITVSVEASNQAYSGLRYSSVGFIPLGSHIVIWLTPLILSVSIITLISAFLPAIRKAAPGLSTVAVLSSILSGWIALDALYAGIYPVTMAFLFDGAKDVSLLSTFFDH